MNPLTFVITKSESFYVASALEESIVTQAETFDDLIKNIEEAISLFFDNTSTPSPYTVVFSSVAIHA